MKPQPEISGLVLVECPYPLVSLGLNRMLRAAGYDVRSGQEGMALNEAPSAAICCPGEEDVAQQVKRLQDLVSGAPVLVLGFGDDLELARAALQAGARGFVHIGMKPSQVVRALSLATEGKVVFSREIIIGLIKEEAPATPVLTERQKEVLELVAEGLTNAQIAERLFLSEYTVKQHLRGIYKLLRVTNRTQAVKRFRQNRATGSG